MNENFTTIEELNAQIQVHLKKSDGLPDIMEASYILYSGDYVILFTKEKKDDKLITIEKPIHLGAILKIVNIRVAEKREILTEDNKPETE